LRKGWQAHWPALIKWLKSLPRPVGIFCIDDTASHDLAAACLDAEISVPDEVAIIGVNNDDLLCEGAWPPLSSVQTDYQRIGHTAARLLDVLIGGGKITTDKRLTMLPPIGVAGRASTDVLAVDEPQLAAAVRFIREHACDPCSVSHVLAEVPVGRRWLERQFIQKLGRTPHDEINHVRMETAQKLLLHRETTITQVAERCGFSTVQSFNRAFQQTAHESPAAFRRARISKSST
jgi:LacI family transcriptional regulator